MKENWTHLQFVQLSLYCTQIKTYDKEYQPKVLSQAQYQIILIMKGYKKH